MMQDVAEGIVRFLGEAVTGQHKDLFPMDSMDNWGTLFVIVGLMVAASGGVGGGGILVPIFMLVYQFKPINAVALSNFTILGASIMNMLINMTKRHPFANRPLVDWDLIMVMEPLTMAGAVAGAFIGKLLPDWLLVTSLVFLLGFTAQKTLEKGFDQYNKETLAALKPKVSELTVAKSDLDDEDDEEQSTSLLEPLEEEKTAEDRQLDAILESEKNTPFEKVQIMVMLFVGVVGLNMLKGGTGQDAFSPIGVQCGTTAYWVLTVLVFAWIIGISIYTRNILLKSWEVKKALKYKYLAGDVEWNPRNTIVYPCMCFFAGLCAGMFGIGGGIVKGPLMLEMGVHPLVASSTVAVMIFFTSIGATSSYISFGTLIWDYAIFLFVVGLAATMAGQYGVSYFVEKYNRVSLISLSIGAVVALSTVMMGVSSLIQLFSDGDEKSSALCEN